MNLVGASAASDLDGLLARSPIAMLLADDQRRYVDVNEAACTLLGLSCVGGSLHGDPGARVRANFRGVAFRPPGTRYDHANR
jgi:PAS domain-containing protein